METTLEDLREKICASSLGVSKLAIKVYELSEAKSENPSVSPRKDQAKLGSKLFRNTSQQRAIISP